MLLLPKIDQDPSRRGSAKASKLHGSCSGASRSSSGGKMMPIQECFHVGNYETSNSRSDIERFGRKRGSNQEDESSSPPPRRREPTFQPLVPPLSKTRSTVRFNGVEAISMSQAGNWLDSRAFNEACVAAGSSSKQSRDQKFEPKVLSEGERFLLKRCRDTLTRRYGSVQQAFKSMDSNSSNTLSTQELMTASAHFMGNVGAKTLGRIADTNGDGVISLHELEAALDAL
eukprot:NODE_11510_length_1282_cov_4.407792.p1 GENE.NODE_11510_length_1282_cov_4.407792~~NODE_11510_length_1282_cov_4.407792.p1  ORF type:complete len:229 (+),score=49.77 NODE_11510_length_1282_cov_4.407792:31-717(+)